MRACVCDGQRLSIRGGSPRWLHLLIPSLFYFFLPLSRFASPTGRQPASHPSRRRANCQATTYSFHHGPLKKSVAALLPGAIGRYAQSNRRDPYITRKHHIMPSECMIRYASSIHRREEYQAKAISYLLAIPSVRPDCIVAANDCQMTVSPFGDATHRGRLSQSPAILAIFKAIITRRNKRCNAAKVTLRKRLIALGPNPWPRQQK